MRKAALFCFAFIGGIIIAQYLLPVKAVIWIIVGLLLLLVGTAAVLKENKRAAAMLILSGVLSALIINCVYIKIYRQPAAELDGKTIEVSVTATDYSEYTKYGQKVTGLLKPQNVKIYLYVSGQYEQVRPGDIIRCEARLRLAEENGEDFSSVAAKGVFLLAYQTGDVEIINCDKISVKYFPRLAANSLKNSIMGAFPEDINGVVAAVVTGDKSGIDEGTAADLNNAGLSHTVVVSGMHMSFLVSATALMGGKSKRKARIGIPIILFFMAMTGFTPSVVRAGVMSIFALIAPACGREYDGATALAVSLALLLAQNPYSIKSVGLQLSYTSTAGIMLFARRIKLGMCSYLQSRHAWLDRLCRFIAASFATSVSAIILPTPLLVLYFGRIAILSPVANLLSLWALSLIFLLGMIVGIVGIAFPGVAAVLMWVPWFFTKYFLFIAKLIGSVKFSVLYTDNVYVCLWLFSTYVISAMAIFGKLGRKKIYLPVGMVCILLCVALLAQNNRNTGIAVADVGQGQCIVARTGDLSVVIDCGGDYRAADEAVKQLGNFGLSDIDYLILTHFHADHASGASKLMKLTDVGCLIIPEDVDDADGLRGEILDVDVNVMYVSRGEKVVISDGQRTITVYPPLGIEGNEMGLSVLISDGEFDALITGDMDSETELRLMDNFRLPDLEMLIIGHHGSKNSTSAELLDVLRPEVAVISVGRDNAYGHPAEETLKRLYERDIEVYRTDLNGTVTVRSGN